ncbi:MAG: cytochrome P450 [Actinobacteria bacterium]|nr:MAG: cytochrome P450 [Actinomycetota bacterium]
MAPMTRAPTTDLSLEEIDFGNTELWNRSDWDGMFAKLRHERPVSWHSEPEIEGLAARGPGFWSLTKYEDVQHASRHPEVFISGQGTNIPDFPPEVYEFLGSMINMDPPRHTRFRLIVNRGFTPYQVAALEHTVRERAGDIVDAVAEKGECDFVAEIASALPLQIICDMMGIAEADYRFVFDKTNVVLGASDPEYGGVITDAFTAAHDLWTYAQELRADRVKEPRDDITSKIALAEVDGHSLTPEEFGSFFVLLMVAGNETTRNAISHGMKALTDYPDQRRIWMDDFEAVTPYAVEEMIRWATPVIHFRRTCATTETEIRGERIKEGDKVVLWYNSANRDEAVFDDPYTFDVRRDPNEHLGFGGGGPHFCLGAHLARREINVIFDELLHRLPDIEVSGEPDYLFSNFIHGIKRMPVSFTPVDRS